MKKTIFLLVALCLLSLLLSGCANSTSGRNATADAAAPKFINGKLDQTFKLKVPTPTGFNEIIIADKKGFLKEVGLEVEYTVFLQQSLFAFYSGLSN